MRNILVLLMCILPFGAFAQANQDAKLQVEKLGNAIYTITTGYVDPINPEQYVDSILKRCLSELDPHSAFYSKAQVKENSERLKGGFVGVGFEPKVIADTIVVLNVIEGGPFEKAGVLPGDRIIEVDGKSIIGIKDNAITPIFRGLPETMIKVKILRRGVPEIVLDVKRDKIPMPSLDAAYFIQPKIGYIKLSRFSATTNAEVQEALKKLKGMEALILDLRMNGGGDYYQAIEVVSNFIEPGRLVVYGEGAGFGRKDELSKGVPTFPKGKIVVLVDQYSASASELVSGALQDWDRATIVGRRTFGKGLMQQTYPLKDGSAIHLTIGRYHTPSGRCVQRDYTMGHTKEYYGDISERFKSGEVTSDKIIVDSTQVYQTLLKGRNVYGGGGILPDVIVPLDTSTNSMYMSALYANGVMSEYVSLSVDKNRSNYLKKYSSFEQFRKNFKITPSMLDELVALGEARGFKFQKEEFEKSKMQIEYFLKASFAARLFKKEDFYKINNEFHNKEILKALEVIKSKE